ncbi:ComF family protein [Brevundimonas sp. A19_0]|uniref:ComF family protein n=1 Tax=Brevundimonas sp. A19_0 TaxID=2821087 RepID=UPI001FD83E44|nr:ComF family protein [Brevundimonas sp. A19_0]
MRIDMGAEGDFWKAGPGARVQSLARSVGRGLADLILPPPEAPGPAGRIGAALSPLEWSRITFLEDPVCDGCGAPFTVDSGDFGEGRCAPCLSHPMAFGRARAACLYDDGSRPLILRFKHADDQPLAPLFARWLSRAARPLLEQADAVVPVPLHRSRLLARRFNQAAEIARPLARAERLDYLPDALVRRTRTASQGGLGFRRRHQNVKGVFSVPDTRRARLRGRHILLVDDVLTTGATAEACAKALLDAGARAVDLAVVARVQSARTMPR